MTDPRIKIVGSGIIGACLAYAASARGARTLVISQLFISAPALAFEAA